MAVCTGLCHVQCASGAEITYKWCRDLKRDRDRKSVTAASMPIDPGGNTCMMHGVHYMWTCGGVSYIPSCGQKLLLRKPTNAFVPMDIFVVTLPTLWYRFAVSSAVMLLPFDLCLERDVYTCATFVASSSCLLMHSCSLQRYAAVGHEGVSRNPDRNPRKTHSNMKRWPTNAGQQHSRCSVSTTAPLLHSAGNIVFFGNLSLLKKRSFCLALHVVCMPGYMVLRADVLEPAC